MTSVASLWRHPIKSHGRESIESVDLVSGRTMPWDRHWAVTHELTKHTGDGWSHCRNFMIGARTPELAAIWATFDETTQSVTLRHPELGTISFRPDDPVEAVRFFAWIEPICRASSVKPAAIISAPERGMTDSRRPTISIMNTASHIAVQDAIGSPIAQERWRANVWLDDLAPWAEFDLVDKQLKIGAATVTIIGPIDRCEHVAANPDTGKRDKDLLSVLKTGFGHPNFGVYAEVVKSGRVSVGDKCEAV